MTERAAINSEYLAELRQALRELIMVRAEKVAAGYPLEDVDFRPYSFLLRK